MSWRETRVGAWLALAVLAAVLPGATRAAEDPAWLAQEPVPADEVTRSLNEIRVLDVPEAARRVDVWKGVRNASEEGKLAAALLAAFAQERSGQATAARAAYEELKAKGTGTPFGVTAAARFRLMDKPAAEWETEQQALSAEAEPDKPEGWFLVLEDRKGKDPQAQPAPVGEDLWKTSIWEYNAQRKAALMNLVRLRASYLSVQCFEWVAQKSPLPPAYGYLFILLVLTLGIKILSLPLLFKTAKATAQLRELAPEIERIQLTYQNDFVAMQQQLQDLYKKNGINTSVGCLVGLIDLVFVIWALITMGNYAPQMALENARFVWDDDVTKFSWFTTLVVVALSVAQPLLSGAMFFLRNMAAQVTCWSIVFSAGLVAVAWWWQWPSYVFVFWLLLMVVGIILNRMLQLLYRPQSSY